jgi:KipI family sensor histidine kinase inhibitor
MKIIPASDSSLLVEFGDAISPETQHRVLQLFHALQLRGNTHIRNLHPAYVSLLIDFDPLVVTHAQIAEMVREEAIKKTGTSEQSPRLVEIPVCYALEFGPDLNDVCAYTGLMPDEVIRLHSSVTYDVCFLGFTAGFAYMGGLPQVLATPRLATPRRAVAEGSVGIAGEQTGIYPTETPGGWRLIGRTPLRMFDPRAEPETLVAPGDQVRFLPVTRAEFDRLWQEHA